MGIIRRGSTFHLVQRVPKRFHGVEPRRVMTISLHTDSEKLAEQKAAAAWGEFIEACE